MNAVSLLESIRSTVWKLLSQHYDYAVVYDGPEEMDIIHEGEIWIYLNGWVETENGDHFSPNTVHRIEDQTIR